MSDDAAMNESIESKAEYPGIRVIEEIIRWYPVIGPVECKCGHEHYGRRPESSRYSSSFAPQWHLCEEETCECRTLRRVTLPKRNDPR